MPVSDRLRSNMRMFGDAPARAVTVISWPMNREPSGSGSATEHGEELRLAVRSVRGGHIGAEHATGYQQVHLGLDDGEAGLNEVVGDLGVLTGALRHVPTVDDHVEHPVAAVDLAG